jgi:hypothetical protein
MRMIRSGSPYYGDHKYFQAHQNHFNTHMYFNVHMYVLKLFGISCSNTLESKTILYCTIRIVQLRIVQYEIVFDSRVLEQYYPKRISLLKIQTKSF